MNGSDVQSYKNHGRLDPTFHFLVAPAALVSFLLAVWRMVDDFNAKAVWETVLAAALVVAVFKIRIYALRVQDRVIRLEERLRLAALLPEQLRARIPELTEDQLIGLRFASDGELPELVEKTLQAGLDRKAIKQSVREWRADTFRV